MKDYVNESKILSFFVRGIQSLASVLMFMSMVAVIFFLAVQIYELFLNLMQFQASEVLKNVALIVILVKAYTLLLYYMKHHHVSIKYIVEISIIAPSVELIFYPQGRDLWLNIIYAVFAFANLVIYVKYAKNLDKADRESADD